MVRGWIAAAVTVLAVAAIPSSAAAFTTIGEDNDSSGGIGCDGGKLAIQVVSPGNVFAAPFNGVLTSWTSNNDLLWNTAIFKAVRPGSGNSFTVLGQDGPQPSDGVPHPIRIPVLQNDVIGVYVPPGGGTQCVSQPASGYLLGSKSADVGVGSGAFDETSASRTAVTAVIEPDKDNDNYGDETQDRCPTNASTHGPCPLPTVLGQTFRPAFKGPAGCDGLSFIPKGLTGPDAGVSYAAPEDGVVTSWSFQTGGLVDGMVSFGVYRPLGDTTYRTMAKDPSPTLAANSVNTFPARIPMRQDDRIGGSVSGKVDCLQGPSGGGSLELLGDTPTGSTNTFQESTFSTEIAAVLEADADDDGFGDTTQDKCPTDATTQAVCPKPPPPGPSAKCKAAKTKLEKAKKKLKQLKGGKHPKKSKVKKAKKKVKKAKAGVKKAC
jgi:hypothetical protein